MNAVAIAAAVRRPRSLMIAAAALATAASLFAGSWTASADEPTPTVPTVPTLPATVPSAPLDPHALPLDGGAKVRWEAPESDGGSPVLYYTVTSDPAGVTATTTDGETKMVKVHGLTNGTEYVFTITATNEVGEGPASTSTNPVTPHPRPNVDALIEKLHAHFERAIEHAEAHAAHASDKAQEHADRASQRVQRLLEAALERTQAHFDARKANLDRLVEKAQGTAREDKVTARVERAAKKMEDRLNEQQQRFNDRASERQNAIEDHLQSRLDQIGNRLDERKTTLQDHLDEAIQKLEDD